MLIGGGKRSELPKAPVAIQDEVELYAREYGRHATLHFIPTVLIGAQVVAGTWMARFTLKDDDKRLSLYRDGKTDTPPTEDVWLHVPDAQSPGGYKPLDLEQLGPSGVRAFLEKGNTWSGRGEWESLEAQAKQVNEANETYRAAQKETARDQVRQMAKDTRRSRLKIPFMSVLSDLRNKGK